MKVLVLVIRGLQIGYVGCYGNAWIDTPALDRLAAEGVVFDRHFADQPDEAGARRAWRTGRYGMPVPDAVPSVSDAVDLLAVLHAAGVDMALGHDERHIPIDGFASSWPHVRPYAASTFPIRQVVKALGNEAVGNGLFWMELSGLLPPWEVAEEEIAPYLEGVEESEIAAEDAAFLQQQAGYAAAVTALDAVVGELCDTLRQRQLLDELLLIITSDHGLPLGEHAPSASGLHEERVHLPLLIRLPGGAEAGRHVSALTQSVDLIVTLLDVFGLPLADGHGKSLLPLARGGAEMIRPYVCSGLRSGSGLDYALRTHDWAFLLPVLSPESGSPRGPQLYVKPDDRWEVNNVVQHHLDLAEQMEATLRAFAAATQRPGPLQPPALRFETDAECSA